MLLFSFSALNLGRQAGGIPHGTFADVCSLRLGGLFCNRRRYVLFYLPIEPETMDIFWVPSMVVTTPVSCTAPESVELSS